MKRPNRKVWGLLALLVTGLLVPVTNRGAGASLPRRLLNVPEAVWQAVESAVRGGESSVQMDVLLETPQDLDELKRLLRQMGGSVTSINGTYVQVSLPPDKVAEATQTIPAVGVGVDETYQVQPAETSAPVQPQPVLSNVDARVQPSLNAMGALDFQRQQGATGAGVKIAIIDSGVDPGHIALQKGPDGERKLIDYKDFTLEGKVFPSEEVQLGASYRATGGRTYALPPLPAGSHPRFGLWSEWGVGGKINRDLDRNGIQIDKFGVLVVDSRRDGQYDQVWVDGNNNGDFRDDGGPLTLFTTGGKYGQLGRYVQRTNFVVADLDPSGQWVSFGFDGLGHGTAVSGVAAGWTAEGYQGAAPGAQLLALKVVHSDGTTSWDEIRRAVQYAAEQGAQVINISIAGLATGTQTDSIQGLWLRQISRTYGTLIVLAAGNGGPGLSSGATVGSPMELLAVGSYYSPAMWKRDYDLVVPTEGLHWTSAVGPRQDGGFVPNLVAPGGAPAPAPLWLQSNPYVTVSGTSIAAPHVSGAAALLIEAGKRAGLSLTPDRISRAMESSARRLNGYDTFEQGFGLLQLPAAFAALAGAPTHQPITVRSTTGGEGLLSRGDGMAGAQLTLTNDGKELERWTISSRENWLLPELTSLTLPPAVDRRLDVRLNPPLTPGVYSSFLEFGRQGEATSALVLPVTYVQPFKFPSTTNRLQWSGDLPVARSERQFIQVDPGLASLQLQARLGPEGNPTGAMQVQVYRPDGRLAYNSGTLGGPSGVGLVAQFQTEHPVAGVWEIIVTALPDKVGAYSQVNWALDARVEAGPIATDLTRWIVSAGYRTNASIQVTNTYAPATVRLEGIGLSRTDLDQPWRTETRLNQIDTFDLPGRAGAVRVEIANPSPAGVDLELKLYRDGTPVPLGISNKPGTSQEVIELRDLPAGRYRVFADVNGDAPDGLVYQYRRLVALQEYGLEVIDPAVRRLRGEKWTVPVTFYPPQTPGRYVGHLMLWNADKGESLNWTTIEVSVGQPQLQIQPLFAPLVRGKAGQVVLEMRSETGALVNGMIKVNGRTFESRQGQVVVPVYPSGSAVSLVVEANLKEYQYFRQEIRVPVSEAIKDWPISTTPNEENSAWWRKYQSELP